MIYIDEEMEKKRTKRHLQGLDTILRQIRAVGVGVVAGPGQAIEISNNDNALSAIDEEVALDPSLGGIEEGVGEVVCILRSFGV